MAYKPLPSQEVLRQLLDYNPETGELRWKERGPEWFTGPRAPREMLRWNGRYAGKPALTQCDPAGYLVGVLRRERYMAHRVIWKLVTGQDPDQVDHINGVKHDNRIENLRNADRVQNNRNAKQRRDNTSGVTGVHFHGASKKWCVKVGNTRLGLFDNFADAVSARSAAIIGLGFSDRHGLTAVEK